MPTHNGKIGALPPLIQDELNHRLLRDESSTTLLAWLNGNPHVVAALRDHFESHPISPQNLSEWRRGGYLQWLIQTKNVVRQRTEGGALVDEPYNGPSDDNAVTQAESCLRREQSAERAAQETQAKREARAAVAVRRAGRPTSSEAFQDEIDALYEDAAHLGDNGIRAKDLLHVITARYAELLQDWGKIPEPDFNERMHTLQQLTKSIAVVRRLEQNDERLDFLREKERKKSRSASSRPARVSGSKSASETAESPAHGSSESLSESRADSQPASGLAVTTSAPNRPSAPSSAPSTESDESDTSDPSHKSPAPNAPPVSKADAAPGGSPLPPSEPSVPDRSLPAAHASFPPNSKERRSRFGLL